MNFEWLCVDIIHCTCCMKFSSHERAWKRLLSIAESCDAEFGKRETKRKFCSLLCSAKTSSDSKILPSFSWKNTDKLQVFRGKNIEKCSATFRSCFYVLLVCQKWEVSTKDGRNRLALSKLRSENSWQRLNKTGKTVKSIIKVPIGRISHKNSNHVKVISRCRDYDFESSYKQVPTPDSKNLPTWHILDMDCV